MKETKRLVQGIANGNNGIDLIKNTSNSLFTKGDELKVIASKGQRM